jgi:hypothetical protein
MTDAPDRAEVLADRVRWLDRYRRRIGIYCGILGALAVGISVSPEWPHVHLVALVIASGFVIWYLTEVAIAYATALWETEHDQLARNRGLPRAIARPSALGRAARR